MSSTVLNGLEFAYTDEGSGDPLVLVHGHPFNRTMWQPQIDRFSPSHRVIAADLRGYGATTVIPGKTTLDIFASDIAALLDHLGLDKVVIGGLSMGGQIVMEFNRLFPDRVAALLLADTTAAEETPEGRIGRITLADRVLRDGVEWYADEVLPKMVAPHNIKAMPDVAAHVLGMMRSTSREGAAAALRGRAERPDYFESLSQVEVPTLVVVGSDDEFTPVAEAKLIHDAVPNSTLVVVDGAAHMPNLERPEEFNTALENLLAKAS